MNRGRRDGFRKRKRFLSPAASEYAYRLLEGRAGYEIVWLSGLRWRTDGKGNFVATLPVRDMIRLPDGAEET